MLQRMEYKRRIEHLLNMCCYQRLSFLVEKRIENVADFVNSYSLLLNNEYWRGTRTQNKCLSISVSPSSTYVAFNALSAWLITFQVSVHCCPRVEEGQDHSGPLRLQLQQLHTRGQHSHQLLQNQQSDARGGPHSCEDTAWPHCA